MHCTLQIHREIFRDAVRHFLILYIDATAPAAVMAGKHQHKKDKGDLKFVCESGRELTAIFNQPDPGMTLSSAGCEIVGSIMGQRIICLTGCREHITGSQLSNSARHNVHLFDEQHKHILPRKFNFNYFVYFKSISFCCLFQEINIAFSLLGMKQMIVLVKFIKHADCTLINSYNGVPHFYCISLPCGLNLHLFNIKSQMSLPPTPYYLVK